MNWLTPPSQQQQQLQGPPNLGRNSSPLDRGDIYAHASRLSSGAAVAGAETDAFLNSLAQLNAGNDKGAPAVDLWGGHNTAAPDSMGGADQKRGSGGAAPSSGGAGGDFRGLTISSPTRGALGGAAGGGAAPSPPPYPPSTGGAGDNASALAALQQQLAHEQQQQQQHFMMMSGGGGGGGGGPSRGSCSPAMSPPISQQILSSSVDINGAGGGGHGGVGGSLARSSVDLELLALLQQVRGAEYYYPTPDK